MASTVYKSFQPKDRKHWRQWLEKNHGESLGVWLVYYKQSSKKSNLNYNDAVEEALCFGWIDSTRRSVDADRFEQRFGPRKPGSGWSSLNKTRIKTIIENGLMTPAGMQKIDDAKKDGSWEKFDKLYTDPGLQDLPADLEKAFEKNKKALAFFTAFPPSIKRMFLYWIDNAKRPETRKARIQQTVLMAAANKKPGLSGFKI